MEEAGKPHKPIRPERDLLDKAMAALQELVRVKGAERASGRFGVMVVLDRGQHAGIRQVTDEAHYVN